MHRHIALILLTTLWLAAPSLAEGRTLLLIPFEMKGSYKPIDEHALALQLKSFIEKAAPELTITVADSTPAMLDAAAAARLGQEAGADYVMFGDLRLRHEAKVASLSGGPSEGYPGGSAVPAGWSSRYMVTLAGVAHGSLVECATGKLLVDEEPQILMESEMTGAVKDGPVMQQLEKRLAEKCVHDIAKGLVERMRVTVKKGSSN